MSSHSDGTLRLKLVSSKRKADLGHNDLGCVYDDKVCVSANCGGSLVLRQNMNGSITSPNFPDVYPSKTECEWSVRAPPGHFVEARCVACFAQHVGPAHSATLIQDEPLVAFDQRELLR